MTLTSVNNNEGVANRTLAVILTAISIGKSVQLRYTQGGDGSPPSCTPTVTQLFSNAILIN